MKRRDLLGAAAAAAILPWAGARAQASGEPITLGSLIPLTGIGGPFGPDIQLGQSLALQDVMQAGGLFGRPVKLMVQDDQSAPEPGIRAAQQLIQLGKVPVIMGTWVSAVAAAIAPMCWESRTMLLCIGSADSLTALPHQGFIARTQPSTTAYDTQTGKYAAAEGAKHLFVMMPQIPFTQATIGHLTSFGAANNIKVSSLVYDGSKSSYREEAQSMLAADPDWLFLGGYVPDNTVLLKDLYRVGYKGRKIALATGITQALVTSVGNAVAEGLNSVEPIADMGSAAYKKLQAATKRDSLGIYLCQGYDEVNLSVLAMAAGKAATGQAIHDNLRAIGDPAGTAVDNAIDGLRVLAAGKTINYLGASSSCKFAPNGDVAAPHFRINVVRNGQITTDRIM